ncbi:hypothetical protein [Pantoea sp.]|uniref:hypothetical protein n=1 Tax=Pantoea sp. TaxID=69393 RepID=UPI0028A9B8EF|nr:hypothetical protein [Pantoea sp.]
MQSDKTLPVATRKRSLPRLSMLFFVVITGVAAIIIASDSHTILDQVMETGQCLTGKGARGFLETLRHFLHQACRWMVNVCG